MGKFVGKTALITGTLQGIGRGIVRASVRYGASSILLDISSEIERLANELCDRGHRCTAVAADVRDPASVAAATKRTREKEGRIGILANNAGVYRLGSFLNMSDEDCDLHVDVNIEGIWSVMKAVLPEMIIRKDGRTVITSPVTGGMATDPGKAMYALMKAAIAGLARSLAVEYAQFDIRANAICPGYACTPIAESTARQSDPEDSESVLIEIAKAIPMRRPADPPEIGELAAFLVPDEPSYLTGIQNVINGDSTLPETVSAGTRFTSVSSLHLWGGSRLIPFSISKSSNGT